MLRKKSNLKLESNLATHFKSLFERHGWAVFNTHGNAYQKGFPDKYCIDLKKRHGQRWVELKRTCGKYTKDQLKTFPLFEQAGIGIWTVTEATEAIYNEIVCGKPNWRAFLTAGDKVKIKEMYNWWQPELY